MSQLCTVFLSFDLVVSFSSTLSGLIYVAEWYCIVQLQWQVVVLLVFNTLLLQ